MQARDNAKKDNQEIYTDQLVETLSIADLLDEVHEPNSQSAVEKEVQHYQTLKYIRTGLLFFLWLCLTAMLFVTKEESSEYFGTVVPVDGKTWPLKVQPEDNKLTLIMKAPFEESLFDIIRSEILKEGEVEPKLLVQVQREFVVENDIAVTETVSELIECPLNSPNTFGDITQTRLVREHTFTLKPSTAAGIYSLDFRLENVDQPLPLELRTFPSAIKTPLSICLSAMIISGMHVLFFWDVVSRGIVTMIFSTLTVGLLGIYHNRLPLKENINYINLDTILLVFGLTLIICIITDTGGDMFLAVQCYRLSKGRIWPMLTVGCGAVAFGAAFLNPTTILLLTTSLAIRLCEISQLNHASVLSCLMIFSNTGYMLTKSGPTGNSVLLKKGVQDYSNVFKGYGSFLKQMFIPVSISMIVNYTYLRYYYSNSERMLVAEPTIVSRLRNGIRFWSRTAQAMSGYTKEETALRKDMLSKANRLRQRLRRLGQMAKPDENFAGHLQQLQEQYKIRDRPMLVISCVILVTVVAMQIAYSLRAHELSPGWTCLLFSLVLLALADWKDFDALMSKIDWSTLITIACLFIISRALRPLGLMEAISNSTMSIVGILSTNYRLLIACSWLLIVSTLSSAFMDSEHVSYVLSDKALRMANDPHLQMQLEPLLLAVLLGAGFGTNATLASSISNIVCSGLAEKHGFKLSFWNFFKVGFVITMIDMVIGIVYLLIFNWVFNQEA